MFIHPGKVAFHQTDAAGIVHFAEYLYMLEEAECAALDSIDMLRPSLERGEGLPRVALQVEYVSPLRFLQSYEMQLRFARVGRSSLHWEGTLIAEVGVVVARLTWSCARRSRSGEAAPFSEEELTKLQSLC